MMAKRQYSDVQRLFREVIATHTTEEDLAAIWQSLLSMAKQGTLKAIEMVGDRIGGKPSVGAFSALLDNAAAEAADDKFRALSTDQMKTFLELLEKVNAPGEFSGGGHLALPAPARVLDIPSHESEAIDIDCSESESEAEENDPPKLASEAIVVDYPISKSEATDADRPKYKSEAITKDNQRYESEAKHSDTQ